MSSNSSSSHLNVLIIGQGLAGSILSMKLRNRGIPFHVIDDGYRSSSSIAAAGLYNPLTLKRRRLAWMAHDSLSASIPFYHEAEKELNIECVEHTGIMRIISSHEEANDWQALKEKEAFAEFLGNQVSRFHGSDGFEADLGFQEITKAGWIKVGVFLKAVRARLQESSGYSTQHFDEKEVELTPEALVWDGEEYSHIIICTGYKSSSLERFFQSLPFTPAKGHILDVHIPDLEIHTPVQGPCFIIPMGDRVYRIGSDYSWKNLNETVESEAVEELLRKAKSMCPMKMEVIEARAGVRPTTNDRRPLIGPSKVDDRVWVFGGLGSKAVMYAPLLSEKLVATLIGQEQIPLETKVSRYA